MTHSFNRRFAAMGFGLALLLALPMTLGLTGTAAFADDETADPAAPAVETAELPWVRDWAKAKELAAKEGKDLFINFTGSDWCVWCMRLDEQVFHHAAFVDEATKKFIFVFMDKPNAPELQKAVVDADARDQLMQDMGVQGFPTCMLATAEGHPYARTGYKQGGPEVYLKHLIDLQADGEKVKKLAAAKDATDVEAIKAGFEALQSHMLLGYPGYAPLLELGEKADADGSLGIKQMVADERIRQLSSAEEKAISKLLPKQNGEQPDWDKIIPALKKTKHMNGFNFLNLVFGSTNWLLSEKRGEDAKALLTFAKRDPMLEKHARAKEIFEDMLGKADALISGETEGDGETKEGEADGDK